MKYDIQTDIWRWGTHSWEIFRNINGLEKLQNANIDINLEKYIQLTRKLANKLQIQFSKGSSYNKDTEKFINSILVKKLKEYSTQNKILKVRESTSNNLILNS